MTPKLPSWPAPLQALALIASPRLRLQQTTKLPPTLPSPLKFQTPYQQQTFVANLVLLKKLFETKVSYNKFIFYYQNSQNKKVMHRTKKLKLN
jgi:hypothetical protein